MVYKEGTDPKVISPAPASAWKFARSMERSTITVQSLMDPLLAASLYARDYSKDPPENLTSIDFQPRLLATGFWHDEL
jgi:hypothetical protein